MIASWLTYIYSLLPIAIRQSGLVNFISILLAPAQSAAQELEAYTADARLRSAATWQVIWMEKLLSDALGYAVVITEGDGMPIDFVFSGIAYNDRDFAAGLINRYKLAGKSFLINYEDVALSARWINPVCALTNQFTYTARWINPVCHTTPAPDIVLTCFVTFYGGSGATDGLAGSIKSRDYLDTELDSQTLEMYAKTATLYFTESYDSNGVKLDLSGILAYLSGGSVPKNISWSTIDIPETYITDTETALFTESQIVYVRVDANP